ncbi:MAG TPA: beta-ketoacyl-ACP synthase III [Rectinemataceae bacterium]|nr:beta-ketoacyl-ACP synthase III [Rectinemataceae bacterium]
MSVYVHAVGVDVPERRLTNEELSHIVDTTDEWIRSHTGIGSRHIAEDGRLTSDLAVAAARKAMAKAGIGSGDLDFIVVATATPDYFGFPSTACIVQEKLGATDCPAFDVTAGCSGFIYALNIATSLLDANRGRHALIVGAETLSRITNWEDRGTCVLLGDGAGAAILTRSDEGDSSVVLSVLGADGGGAEDLRLIQSERTKTFHPAAPIVPLLEMNGRKVYNFAVQTIPALVNRLLKLCGKKLDEFAWIVPHQANARIIQAAAKRLGTPEERFYMNIEEYANTSSASIPIALNEMDEKGLLKRGDLLMLLAFGSGLTYGGTVLRW